MLNRCAKLWHFQLAHETVLLWGSGLQVYGLSLQLERFSEVIYSSDLYSGYKHKYLKRNH